jgi:DNA (cytosine-5)-methyltransferase 1
LFIYKIKKHIKTLKNIKVNWSVYMNIVDLFSGAGGLTFGFYYNLINNQFVKTDNKFIFANEYAPAAAKAFSNNYPDIHMENCDIKKLDEEKVRSLISGGLNDGEEVDLIIGGPPCQSFSTVGQRIFDEKATMYEEYLRLLNIVRPKMFLFENVKGILSMKETFYETDENGEIKKKTIKNNVTGKESKRPIVSGYGRKVMDIIEEKAADIDNGFGYKIIKTVLNAVNFGVPESRERVFIIGIRNDLNIDFDWDIIDSPQVTIEEAISDLPVLAEGENIAQYDKAPQTEYQILMRGYNNQLTQHFCGNYGDKIRTVIQNIQQGQGKNDFNALIDQGVIDEKYRLTSGYANTYGRLVADRPSTTITNNMCTPSGLRCIHYSQDRALSPREGARIQSFPDWFQFYGNKDEVTKQIGNAVPPLLALRIASKIEDLLG